MLRYRDIVHHLSEEFPVDSRRKVQEQAEWNTLTNLCQSLDVCVQDPFKNCQTPINLALAFQIGQIQAGLEEEPCERGCMVQTIHHVRAQPSTSFANRPMDAP
ncbi:MAG: hypothetical protein IPO40_16985 [Fibrobacteres bacterium]|nr:hypothetical protein [Fibrobacterota bacterium]